MLCRDNAFFMSVVSVRGDAGVGSGVGSNVGVRSVVGDFLGDGVRWQILFFSLLVLVSSSVSLSVLVLFLVLVALQFWQCLFCRFF